jgi:hypothetical protein
MSLLFKQFLEILFEFSILNLAEVLSLTLWVVKVRKLLMFVC